MKKIISAIIIFATIFCIAAPSVSASNITEEKILETVNRIYDGDMRGLITSRRLSLSKTSSQLIIAATTIGNSEVTKCGFTYIKLQRLIGSSWTDYATYCYYDQYNNSNTKNFTVYASAPHGYTYRVVCEHYAEKPRLVIFTTSETSYNETTSLYF